MKRIWSETIAIAEGYNERRFDLGASAWWDKATGTLRIELLTLDRSPYGECSINDRVILDTVPTREKATRRVIASIDSYAREITGDCMAMAQASIEAGKAIDEGQRIGVCDEPGENGEPCGARFCLPPDDGATVHRCPNCGSSAILEDEPARTNDAEDRYNRGGW
jgi:predicted RNA-binding Zn-ribbon protein involved in translation (DUF1610 family)